MNGWTNLKCMVYDYEKVVYYMSDADRVADKRLFETTARKGAALPTADAPTATRDGYTFKFWSREGQSSNVTGQTVNGWTNLYANWEKIPEPTKENIEFNGKDTVYVKCDIYGTHAELIAYDQGEYDIVPTSDTTANLVFKSASYLAASKYADDHALAAVSDPEVSTQIVFKDGKWQQLKNGPTVHVRCKVTLTYDAHAPEGKPVTNMPDPLKVTQTLDEGSTTTFYLSEKIPACEGYVFLGWTSDTTLDVPTIPVEWKTENNGANWKTTTGYPGYTLYAVWQKLTPVYAYMQPMHKDTALTSKDAKITAALKDLGFEEGFNQGEKFVTIGKTETDKTDLNDVSKQVTDEIDNGTFAAYEKVHATTAVLAKIDWNELKLVDAEHKGYTDDGKIEGYHLNGTLSFCDVQFKPNGDNVKNMPADVYHLQYTDIALATPTREGYTFKGWSVQEDGPTALDAFNGAGTLAKDSYYIRNDTIFTAQWEAENYTITYEYNDKDIKNKPHLQPQNPTSYTIEDDDIILNPITANGEFGKQFVEWRCDLNKDDVAETITEIPKGTTGNLTISARWNYPVNYTVFDKNGDKIDSLSKTEYVFEDVLRSEEGYKLTALTQDGYTFDGWYQDDDDLGKTEKLIEGQTLKKAKKWELYGKLTPKEYTVTATLFLNDTNTGIKKSVVGLYDTDIDFDGLKAALKTAALEADKLNKPNQEKIDIEICVNNPSKAPFTATTYGQAGYEWREMQHPKDNPVKKWTVAYTWAHVYTYYDVTFDTTVEGLTVPKQTIKYGELATEPAAPSREGYKFLGWYEGDVKFDFTNTKITKETKLTAKWEKKDYIIASDLRVNGGEPVKDEGKTYSWTHRYGGKYEETINYQPMFDALKARALEADKANEPNTTRVDVELRFPGSKDRLFNEEIHTYGQEGGGWNPGVKNTAYIWGYAWTYYDVTFVTGVAGQTVEPQLVKSGDKAVKPEDPTMKGYNFLGWFDKDGNPFDFDTEITHKTELKAQWEKKDYIIASDLRVNGGEPVKDEGKTYSWTHRYGGKYEETINYQPMFDALKARALEADKANEPNTTRVDVELRFPGSKDRLFNEEIHTYGQEGGGWNPGVKNTAYIWGYAWTYYDVTFVTPEGATTVDAKLIRNGDCAAKPADPTKEGWKFLGWYADSAFKNEFNFNAPITKKTSVYAKFELVSTPIGDTYVRYDVLHIKQLPDGSYDEANAEIEHLQAKKDSTVTAVVKDYSASHHVTVNTDKSFLKATAIQPHAGADGKPVYTILKVYYDLDYHTLTFDTMGGSRIDPVTVRHGNAVARPKDPVNGGYIFDGWYTDKTYRTPYNFATVLTQDTTIYAKWFLIALPGVTVKKTTPKLNTSDHFAYVQGYPDGTVKPTGNITRAETAAILFRLMDEDSRKTYYSTKSGFRDVAAGSWYNTYVATLNNAGVITDSSNGYFRPNKAITRAELAAMLAQFADTKSAPNYFTDVTANYWAANAIAVCAKLGWINGYPDGTFRPDQTVTRAEMMAMINRALERTPKSAADLLAGMKVWSDNANVNAWYYLDVQEATNSHTYTKSGTHETWKKLR